MNQSKLFSWRSAFCLCLVFTHCLRVFIYKEHIKKSNLALFYLGSTMRTNRVPFLFPYEISPIECRRQCWPLKVLFHSQSVRGVIIFSQTFKNKTRASFIEMCRLSQFVIFYRPLKFLICTYSPGKAKTILFWIFLKKKQPASDPASDPASNLAGGGN